MMRDNPFLLHRHLHRQHHCGHVTNAAPRRLLLRRDTRGKELSERQTGNDVTTGKDEEGEAEEGNIELWDDRRENRPTFYG
ncbi:hypothetical protein E2C01_052290 [Portunus trituberculatus]|uniref:Uncharacterized protein n=1 Tax=Portunus trituberculatus TaxID=210409 RepID=A0A5B7GNZ7_PORTR|nr:hypothetical protein [Portunus trituberculatus]